MPLLNYTTSVPANRTLGELQAILAKAGASAVATMYDDGNPVGLTFLLRTPHGERSFTLPVDVVAVQKVLQTQKGVTPRQRERAHAERVAWRIVKDWLEAQVALIQAQMASLDQVMLPYLNVDDGRTLYAAYRDREQLALPAGGDS